MKYFIFFLCIVNGQFLSGQCQPESFISRQADLNAFIESNPNCTSIEDLHIAASDTMDLTPLENITSINKLRISGNVFSLRGLENLKEVGEMELNNCEIQNLEGLNGIETIEEMVVLNCFSLATLNGLDNIQSINKLDINRANDLVNITGLQNISTLNTLLIRNSGELTSLDGLENITTAGIYIEEADNLEHIKALSNLTIANSFTLKDCGRIESLEGLENLKKVNLDFIIENNRSLESIDIINQVDTIIGALDVTRNSRITEVNGFNNLSKLGGLVLTGTALHTINGFENLEDIDGSSFQEIGLHLSGPLTFISDFPKLKRTFDLLLSLQDYDLNSQFNALEEVESDFTIFGNSLDIENFLNLEKVGGNFKVGCDCIVNLNGVLSKLNQIDGSLILSGIKNTEINYFLNVTEVGGLIVENCDFFETLQSLNHISLISGIFRIDNCANLTSVSAFEETIFEDSLAIEFKDLAELREISIFKSLNISGSLRLENCSKLINISGFENLKEVKGDPFDGLNLVNLPVLPSFSAFRNLEFISGEFELSSIDSVKNMNGFQKLTQCEDNVEFRYMDNLESLDGINNNLSIGWFLRISDNPKLNSCNYYFICKHIDDGNSLIMRNNGLSCNWEPNFECEFTEFKINSFYDINQNGELEEGEPLIQNIIYSLNDIAFNFSNSGNVAYGILGFEGNDDLLTFIENPDWILTSDSISYQLIEGALEPVYSFAFFPTNIYHDLKIDGIISPNRCNRSNNFSLNLQNNGTSINSGTIWIDLNKNVSANSLFDSYDTISSENYYGFHFENHALGDIDVSFLIDVSGPPEIAVGDSSIIKAWADFEYQNENYFTDTLFLKSEIACSYDPNDKLVKPKREDNLTLFSQELNYTIRFQNTGNAEAYDVIIRDTLDDHLDPSTFKLISSSHDEVLQTFIKADKYITFEFKDIFLPDSTTDFDKSNGYVSYSIDPYEGLDEMTSIKNTASIYFDQNPPIVTNTTENILVSMFPTSIHNVNSNLDIRIFPNPTDGVLYFEGSDLKSDGIVNVYTIDGKLIKSVQMSNKSSIGVEELNAGIYLLQVWQEAGIFPYKFVVE